MGLAVVVSGCEWLDKAHVSSCGEWEVRITPEEGAGASASASAGAGLVQDRQAQAQAQSMSELRHCTA